jgi:glycosyltransferase involved in cell wall biosynthesis
MASVYRARALANPTVEYDLVFAVDRGGATAFADLPNCDVRIVRKDRLPGYISYVAATRGYSAITVTSQPELLGKVTIPPSTKVVYEVHSPNENVVRREVESLDVTLVDEIWAPSGWAVNLVERSLPRRKHVPVRCNPNLLDETRFNATDDARAPLLKRPGRTPVLWIGRMENEQKNYIDFLRVLRALPEQYYGLMLCSYEKDPSRLGTLLGTAGVLGVEERIDLYFNVAQQDVAALHRAVRDAGGVFCSTALSESFGYGVVEAAACGLPVAGYDVGPLREHGLDRCTLVPVGDLPGLAGAVRALSRRLV